MIYVLLLATQVSCSIIKPDFLPKQSVSRPNKGKTRVPAKEGMHYEKKETTHHKKHFDIVEEQKRKHLITSDITNATMNKTTGKIDANCSARLQMFFLEYSNNSL